MTTRIPVGVFFALFTISGFAGLIYQSIWSHYLKLFLGHAAYAQTLVLAIFMGGMAVGSWLVSRYTDRIRHLLLGYAIAELGIGVLAIVFHGAFKAVTGWAFDSVLPGLGSPAAVDAFKWVLASALIMPASILLGTTFPLMSAGIIRAYPGNSARVLAMLYFTNSLGASAGVLASGFYLIELVGLPGTMLSAGILNIALALVVWALLKSPAAGISQDAGRMDGAGTVGGTGALFAFILVAVAATGAASFVYEVTWIRMLSLGLGSSSHAFEVMLSAFILGMALGGLLLRSSEASRKGDLGWLAGTLVAKGALAALAIGVYPAALDFIVWVMKALARTDEGYALFNVASHVASMMVMLPAAVCAGMTLPIATNALVVRGFGESSIGKVYAANTAGCILGAAFATHVGMEALGVKGLTALGGATDIALGIVIVAFFLGGSRARALAAAAAVALVAAVALSSFDLDKRKMSSAVYRYGDFLPPTAEVTFYRDGKTATVSTVQIDGTLTIRTNGKPDAGVEMKSDKRISSDEPTMVLAGLLPLTFHPEARTFANIGFGSGLTTHAVLANPSVVLVDSIEIERMMIEGARQFGRKNERAYSDPRSRIHIDDAKTFFASRGTKYDVIVSEPSNPWVSGVATLFSEEFYAQVSRYLKDDGLLIQWIQVYEIDFELVASIFKALGKGFGDYVVFTTNEKDLLIVATKASRLPPMDGRALGHPNISGMLASVGVHGLRDLENMRIGTRRTLEPLFRAGRVPANSDYFPVVDVNAPRLRFRNASATDLTTLTRSPVSLITLAEPDYRFDPATLDSAKPIVGYRRFQAMKAAELAAILLDGRYKGRSEITDAEFISLSVLRSGLEDCNPSTRFWLGLVARFYESTTAYLDAATMRSVNARLLGSKCFVKLSGREQEELRYRAAIAMRDREAIVGHGLVLLRDVASLPPAVRAEYVQSTVSALIASGEVDRAKGVFLDTVSHLPVDSLATLPMRLVVAHLGLPDPTTSSGVMGADPK